MGLGESASEAEQPFYGVNVWEIAFARFLMSFSTIAFPLMPVWIAIASVYLIEWYWALLGSFTYTVFFELLWYVWIRCVVAPLVHVRALNPPPHDQNDPTASARAILGLTKVLSNKYSMQYILKGYFLDTVSDLDEIYSENLESFFAFACFNRTRDEITDSDQKECIKTLAKEFAEDAGIDLKPGFNEKVKHYDYFKEPVEYSHNSIVIISTVKALDNLSLIYLRFSIGMEKRYYNGNEYWYRPALDPRDQDKDALVMYHGICIGWISYFVLIARLGSNRPIILMPMMDCVRITSLCFTVPSRQVVTDAACAILKLHAVERCVVLGHSYGSVTSAWLAKAHPHMVSKLILLDPVSICMCLPDII